jgi:hypothetical protein
MFTWLMRLFGWRQKAPAHRHDYDMKFVGASSLDYRLICSCGDVAPDMTTALERMGLR